MCNLVIMILLIIPECMVVVIVYYSNCYLVYYPSCYFPLPEAQAQECTQEEACLYFADVGRQGVFSMPVGGGPHTRVPVSGGLVAPRGVAFDPSTDTLFITNLASTRYITKYSEDLKEKTQRYNLPGKWFTPKQTMGKQQSVVSYFSRETGCWAVCHLVASLVLLLGLK